MLDSIMWPSWAGDAVNLVIGLGFCLGIILMNVPQHYLCWKHRSADGLSLAYILICTLSNFALVLATFMADYHTIMDLATSPDSAVAAIIGNNTAITANDATLEATSPSRMLLQDSDDESSDWLSMNFLLRAILVLNAGMPTIQNFMCCLVGVPSLVIYYFWFSAPLATLPIAEEICPPVGTAAVRQEQQPLLGRCPSTLEVQSGVQKDDDSTTQASCSSSQEELEAATPAVRRMSSSSFLSERYYYSDGTEARLGKFFTVLVWILVVIAIVISGVVLADGSPQMQTNLMQIWGSTAAVTNVILYIPQIITTHRNQHEGVLSLVSLAVSVGGDLAQIAFWIFSAGESVWVYGACAVDAGMQLILGAMIISLRKKRLLQERQQTAGTALIRQSYSYVYGGDDEDNSGDAAFALQQEEHKGEIEVVYGEIVEIYSCASTAVEMLWEKVAPTRSFDTPDAPTQ